MRAFGLVWLGQAVSLLGSGLSEFALGLWVYQRTGSVTRFAFVLLFRVLPVIALSPLAGLAADRFHRRHVMLIADTGAALSTLALALLFVAGRLEPWHVYLGVVLSSACGAFQAPAYLASVTQLVPPEQLGRANGLLQLGQGAAEIAAPLLAGALIGPLRLHGLILFDGATFLFAVTILLFVRWPALTAAVEQPRSLGGIRAGLNYIGQRPMLVGLLLYFSVIYSVSGFITALLPPLVLSFAPPVTLGAILSVAGAGFFTGGAVLAAWGGPRRRLAGLFGAGLIFGLCVMLIGARPSVLWIAAAAAGAHFAYPFVAGFNQAVWQTAVAPEIQGRVFALRQAITRAAQPLAFAVAGPLADRVFVPVLAAAGPGRGIGLLLAATGMIVLVASAAGMLRTTKYVRFGRDTRPA
jgi:MFS family permease